MASSWAKYIHQRIQNNKNFIGIITGPTGSGKSWSGLGMAEQFAEEIGTEFDIDNVIFKPEELMRLINGNKLERGSVILWDEAGVNLSNKNWQSLTNKMINLLIQTFRHKGFVLLFTVPYQDFVDLGTRKLFHAEMQTVSINKSKQTCRLKPKLLQYNAALKKWYFHYLKIVREGSGTVKIKRWDVKKPSDSLIKAYERKKTLFTRNLNKEIEINLELAAETNKRKPLTQLQEKILQSWEKGQFKQIDMARSFDVVPAIISQNIKYMRNKGYFIEKYRDLMENSQSPPGKT